MNRKYILPLFLLFQLIFLRFLAFFPEVVERFYSNGLFVYLSYFLRWIFGKITFSVGDIFYSTLLLYFIYWFYKNRMIEWKIKLWSILSFVSIFYFLFHILWAFNYYREPLFEKMHIKREYSNEDLYAFTQNLIVKTNEIQFQITKTKNQKVSNPYSQDSIFQLTQSGYDILAKQYPFFKYDVPSRKKSLLSLPLTYMGFAGYLNPFTNESQVNYKIPMYNFPNVICHEMAHQIGYASESECNFIGFLACIKNESIYFQYAAYSTSLQYCMNNVFLKNEQQFIYLKKQINTGVLLNYKESRFFWKEHETIIDKGFQFLYDHYLKSNNQKEGIESYSKYVDLLINYNKKHKII